MKNIKSFVFYTNESKDYKLPLASGDSEKDEEIFWFSTENKERSLVLDMFFEMINMSVESGKKLKGKEINAQDFRCEYKPGDKNIYYNYEFWTEDEEIVKKSQTHYKGHEWQLICEIPYDIIEKLNSGDIKVEEARKRIESESSWTLRDGMDAKGLIISGKDSPGGWQLKYILGKKSTDRWIESEKSKDSKNPKWIQKLSSWLTSTFG